MTQLQNILSQTTWRTVARPLVEALAEELEAMVEHSVQAREEDASPGDLLEDLETRLERLVARLRGQEDQEPMVAHYPMKGEVR